MKKILLSLIFLLGLTISSHAIVTNTVNKNILACNGALTTFQYTFPLIDTVNASDLQVSQFDNLGNQTILSTNYSVNTTTGTVTYPVVGTACPSGYTIVLLRIEPLTQGVAASYQGPGPTPPVMNMSDKLTMISQQLNEQIGRALLLPVNSSGGATFPGSDPGYLIGWNGSGVLSNINNPAAVAQWSLSGANISYSIGNVSTPNTFTAANIGVGSTAPGSTLDVQGTARFLTGNVGVGTDTTPDASLEVTQLTGTPPFMVSSTATTNGDYLEVNNGGNVGVNSTNPGQKLDIQGSMRVSGFYYGNMAANVGIGSANPGQALDVTGTVRATMFAGYYPYVKVSNTQTSGTAGGTSTSGSWQTLPLNTKDNDTASIATLNSSAISLPAGTYLVRASSPFASTSNNLGSQMQVYNNTSSTVLVNGQCMSWPYNTLTTGVVGSVSGIFTLASTSSILIRYQVSSGLATYGLGQTVGYGTEVYAVAEFTKIQ